LGRRQAVRHRTLILAFPGSYRVYVFGVSFEVVYLLKNKKKSHLRALRLLDLNEEQKAAY
jgi:hypothetical protein